jgi:Protein of unknown function (DUF1496)
MPAKPDHVTPQEQGKKNTPIAPKPTASDVCYWNGQPYSVGAVVCSDHVRYRCIRTFDGTEWFPDGQC